MEKDKPSYEDLKKRIHELEKNMEDFKLYREMIENSLDPIFMIDDDENCRMIYVNEAAKKHYGAPLDEIYKWHIPDFDPNFSYDKLQEHVEEIKRLKHLDIETHHKVNGDEIVPVEVSVNLIKYKGHICHYGYIKNISERKRFEQLLIDGNEKISLLMNSTAEGIIGIDLNGKCTYANKAGIKLLGYAAEEDLIGKDMHQLMHHSHSNTRPIKHENCKIQSIFRTGEGTHSDDEVFWRADGTCFSVEYFSYPQLKNGELVGAVVTFNDITERKLTEKRIQEYNEVLKELNATKDKFFSIMAHDLKNPFNYILGFLKLLSEEYNDFSDEQRLNMINIISNSSHRTYKLLENLLEWSRLQQGDIRIKKKEIALKELVYDSIDPYVQNAHQKQIRILNKVEDGIRINSDTNVLKTAIRNIFFNAIKYTENGGSIEFNVEQAKNNFEIHIKDTGIGMKPETIQKLFRIEESDSMPGTNNEKGTGLGLIICKELVQKVNGNIRVESELGKGSEFIISIPA
jgi:PAS domain S-box-containing protein